MQHANFPVDFSLSDFRTNLISGAEKLEIVLTEEQIEQCERFAQIILDENTRQNLTRIVSPEGMAVKHFLDSFTILPHLSTPSTLSSEGARVLDVGTGLGFPGIALKIQRPDISLTLLDSLRKRLVFLEAAASSLQMPVETVHARAEDAQELRLHRGKYQLVTARAVAALPKLLAWCGPFVKRGGYFVAMKAGGVSEEMEGTEEIAQGLGFTHVKTVHLTLPDTEKSERILLIYQR
jgi:16S rRNA (guanine527-N7)-methyltransferase